MADLHTRINRLYATLEQEQVIHKVVQSYYQKRENALYYVTVTSDVVLAGMAGVISALTGNNTDDTYSTPLLYMTTGVAVFKAALTLLSKRLSVATVIEKHKNAVQELKELSEQLAAACTSDTELPTLARSFESIRREYKDSAAEILTVDEKFERKTRQLYPELWGRPPTLLPLHTYNGTSTDTDDEMRTSLPFTATSPLGTPYSSQMRDITRPPSGPTTPRATTGSAYSTPRPRDNTQTDNEQHSDTRSRQTPTPTRFATPASNFATPVETFALPSMSSDTNTPTSRPRKLSLVDIIRRVRDKNRLRTMGSMTSVFTPTSTMRAHTPSPQSYAQSSRTGRQNNYTSSL